MLLTILRSLLVIAISLSFPVSAKISLEILSKPNVTILATGGTIAGQASSSTDTVGYSVGGLTIDSLITAVPQLFSVAKISAVQIANVDSNEITMQTLLTLSKQTQSLLNEKGQQGIVITHGTDTLEETALFLDLTVKSEQPIVLVGAMRPASAISADGPLNLYQAVALAASAEAKNRGTLVVLNDRIASGFYITKTNANVTDTFKSVESGYLGLFIDEQPRFYFTPSQPINKPFFDITSLTELPKVTILYGHQEFDVALIDSAIEQGARGIVIAATGNGSLSKVANDKVASVIAAGTPVVIASRTGAGFVSKKEIGIASGFYNPQKARIVLSLALTESSDIDKIRTYFVR